MTMDPIIPEKAIAPEIAPKKAAKKTKAPAPDLTPFSELLAQVEGNLDEAAFDLLSDRFRADGIGTIGNIFRRLQDSKGKSHEEDHWSQILDLAARLWSAGNLDASVMLLKDANLRLTPPDVFCEHFRDSIAFGEDAILARKAEQSFKEGNDVAALAAISRMTTENRADAETLLKSGTQGRQKSRRLAFICVGVIGVFLFGASIYSIGNLRTLINNPPTYALPSFDLEKSFPDFDSGQGEEPAVVQAPPSGIASPPEIADPPSQPPSDRSLTPITVTTQSASGGIFDEALPVEPALPGPEIPAQSPVAAQQGMSGPEGVGAPASDTASLQEPPREAPEADPETVSSCALAFRVAAQASRTAAELADPVKIGRAERFKSKFIAACGALGIDLTELEDIARTIPLDTIATYSANILAND